MPDDIRSSLEEAFAAKSTGKPLDAEPAADIITDVDDADTREADSPADKVTTDASDEKPKEVADSGKKDESSKPADTDKKPDAKARIDAPVKWTKEEKEAWDKMTEGLEPAEAERVNKIKSILVSRNRSMEGEFTRQMQAIASTRKAYDEIDAVLKPHRTKWHANGISDAAGLKQLLDGFRFSEEKPIDFIKWIAEMRGIDLAKAFGAQPRQAGAQDDDGADNEPPLHPAIKRQLDELRAENQRLNANLGRFGQTFQERQQQEQQALSANVQREIEAFANATDEAGQPKHPFFAELRGEMKRFLDSGAANSLEEAYDIAVHANPTTRQKVLDSLELQRKREWEAKQREEAARARRAGGSISVSSPAVSHNTGTEPPANGSIRDTLEAEVMARLNKGGRI